MFSQFSPNMLKTYDVCPRKFFFKYVKNISMPVNDEIFEFGKNIHALASYYLRGENIDLMEQALSEKERVVWDYLKSVSYFSYEVVNTEYSLTVKVGENYFGGRLDALVKKDDTYFILDYKTGSVPKNSIYDFQTMIYILAVSKFFKTDKVKFIYIDLKNRAEVNIELTEERSKEYSHKLIEITDKINKSDEHVRKQECKCEYSILCF